MSLGKLLEQQQRRLHSVIELLGQERALLSEANIDSDQLAELAKRKQTLLKTLEESETLRQGVQRRLGYAEGAEGARQAAADAGCAEQWAEMLEITREAQRLNILIGELVTLRMEQNSRLLDFMHEAAEKNTYGASGRVAPQAGRINASV